MVGCPEGRSRCPPFFAKPGDGMRYCRIPEFRNLGSGMDIVKLGKKGQVSLPAAVLRKLGLQGAATLLVEATEEGTVVLRPAAVYPIELYSDARLKEFEQADRLSRGEAARVRKALKGRKR